MKRLLHILLISSFSVFICGCRMNQVESDVHNNLMEIFDTAEATIRQQGNYPKSLELYLAFIRGAENDPTLESELLTAYISVAVIYSSFNDNANAINYNRLAYSLARKLGNGALSELALINLAGSYLEMDDYNLASQMADSLLSLDLDSSPTQLFYYDIIKSEVALHYDNLDEAHYYIRQIEKEANDNHLPAYEQSASFELLSRYYEKVSQPDSQLLCLNRVWELVEKGSDPQPKAESARSLMIFHTSHGNTEEAHKFQTLYLNLTDSLINLKQFLNVSARHQQSQINLKGNEITLLQQVSRYQRTIIIVVVVLLIIAICFLSVIFYQKHRLNITYQALFSQSQRLMGLKIKDSDSGVRLEHTEQSISEDKMTQEEDARTRLLYDKIIQTMDSTREYLNPEFGLSNLVSLVDSNVTYVSKVIKMYSDMNVPSFINEYRIREACRRILDEKNYGHLTFAAIGESVGFSSQVSFNRAFKKAICMSPSVYKRMSVLNRRSDH